MSANPSDEPKFDFVSAGADFYDSSRIADEVVWPMVDRYWRGDWRDDSKICHELSVQKSGTFNGVTYDVNLTAHNNVPEEEIDPEKGIPIISIATIALEEIVQDERRDFIFNLAKRSDKGGDITKLAVEHIVSKTVIYYSFDDIGNIEDIESHQLLERIDGQPVWHSDAYEEPENTDQADYDEDEDENEASRSDGPSFGGDLEPKIYRRDLEIIEAGVYILGAPAAIQKALKSIRSSSIEPRASV